MKSKGQFNAGRVCALKGISCGFWRTSEQKAGTHQGKQYHELQDLLPRLVLLPTVLDTFCCLLKHLTFLVMPLSPDFVLASLKLWFSYQWLYKLKATPLGAQRRIDADGNWRELFAHPPLLYHLFLLTSAALTEQSLKLCEPPIPENLVLLRSRVILTCPIILFISPCTCYSQCGLCSFSPL